MLAAPGKVHKGIRIAVLLLDALSDYGIASAPSQGTPAFLGACEWEALGLNLALGNAPVRTLLKS
jgi:hypothetical protein